MHTYIEGENGGGGTELTPTLLFTNNKLRPFYQQIGLKSEEETNKMLQLEHEFVWCCNLDTSGSRSEIPGKF